MVIHNFISRGFDRNTQFAQLDHVNHWDIVSKIFLWECLLSPLSLIVQFSSFVDVYIHIKSSFCDFTSDWSRLAQTYLYMHRILFLLYTLLFVIDTLYSFTLRKVENNLTIRDVALSLSLSLVKSTQYISCM